MTNRTLGLVCAAGGLSLVVPISVLTAQQTQPDRPGQPPSNPRPTQPGQPNPPGRTGEPSRSPVLDPRINPPDPSGGLSQSEVDRLIADWPSKPKEAARTLISKYGPPSDGCKTVLIWKEEGPWHKTCLMNHEIEHHFPIEHTDFLEQVVFYKVPVDKFDDLAQFEGSVYPDRTAGTLAARCDKEENNILILNLAHEVITGKRSPEDARKAASDFVKQAQSGQKPEIMQRLMFQPQTRAAADPDTPMRERAATDEIRLPPNPPTTGGG